MIKEIGGLPYYVDHCLQIHKRRGTGVLKLFPDKDGYLKVVICNKGTYNYIYHRLVWEWVHGIIPDGMTVDHIDGDKLNNHPSNLQLLSAEDNAIKGNAKVWIVVDPDGNPFIVHNLQGWCKARGFHRTHLISTSKHNSRNKFYKGYKAYDFS